MSQLVNKNKFKMNKNKNKKKKKKEVTTIKIIIQMIWERIKNKMNKVKY